MHSKLFVGRVSHRRFIPHEHAFNYKMFMMYLDLDELPSLFDHFLLWSARGFNLAYFTRKDHMGDTHQSLKQSVINLVKNKAGISLNGPIRLLTHLRYFGYGFNPVSFYYCFDEKDEQLQVIVAEVNNTPWGEQHCYVLPVDKKQQQLTQYKFELDKQFHVSPFHPMDHNYQWFFTHKDHHLGVHMENWKNNEKVFYASLSLGAQTINGKNLARALIHFPFMTVKVSVSIYYQALQLWLKRTPLYTHPDKIIADAAKNRGS